MGLWDIAIPIGGRGRDGWGSGHGMCGLLLSGWSGGAALLKIQVVQWKTAVESVLMSRAGEGWSGRGPEYDLGCWGYSRYCYGAAWLWVQVVSWNAAIEPTPMSRHSMGGCWEHGAVE